VFVPWKPRVSEAEVRQAIAGATTWRAVLDALGYAYHGKNIATIRKWAGRWGLSTVHLSDMTGRPRPRLTYSEADLRDAVAASYSWAEALRRLGYCPTGGNSTTLKKRVAESAISTDHFDPYRAARQQGQRRRIPLEEVLVERSTYSRSNLKRRLYEAGLKEQRCELCGQDENWRGRRIGLILDHINGIRDDNRLENLRIVCPNCAAGLDTHCGRKNRLEVEPRQCLRCDKRFVPKDSTQRYCSAYCGRRWDRSGVKRSGARKVRRPGHEQLRDEVIMLGYSAVGRKYGVSDNAIRKWVRFYENEIERRRRVAAGELDDPGVAELDEAA
jgi:hypothetical protein